MKITLTAAFVLSAICVVQTPAHAFPGSSLTASAIEKQDTLVVQAQFAGRGPRGGAAVVGRRGGAVAVGPRGGAAVRGPVRVAPVGPAVRRGAVVAPGVGRRGVVYVGSPYRTRYWRPGVGWAVGSVVAIGALTAAAAAAYAPPPPYPNACWYYADPSYRTGYWAQCQY